MSPSPRPVKAILSEALYESKRRQDHLRAFQRAVDQEMATIDTVIWGLRALLVNNCEPDAPVTALPSRTSEPVPLPAPPPAPRRKGRSGALMDQAIATVAASEVPLTREQIAQVLGRNGPGLAKALTWAVRGNRLVTNGDTYTIPSQVKTEAA